LWQGLDTKRTLENLSEEKRMEKVLSQNLKNLQPGTIVRRDNEYYKICILKNYSVGMRSCDSQGLIIAKDEELGLDFPVYNIKFEIIQLPKKEPYTFFKEIFNKAREWFDQENTITNLGIFMLVLASCLVGFLAAALVILY
jgi:hypothetical protein